jgi:hypothetical protein
MLPLQIAKAIDGEVLRPRLTVEGLREMIGDLRQLVAQRKIPCLPRAIYVSESDRRDINQDLLAGSVEAVAKDDQRPEHDGQAIGVIEGVVILTDHELAPGKARVIFPPPVARG